MMPKKLKPNAALQHPTPNRKIIHLRDGGEQLCYESDRWHFPDIEATETRQCVY